MKRLLRFLPLGLGISSAIIYLINVVQFKVINNSVAMLQILLRLRTYLYISIFGFFIYFLVRFIERLKYKSNSEIIDKETETNTKEIIKVVEKPIVKTEIKEIIITGNKYCDNCGEKIFDTDNYCKTCGTYQKDKKSGKSPLFNKAIYVLKIVILILILYFLLNMLFEYKEKQDSNFKSPFHVEMTK